MCVNVNFKLRFTIFNNALLQEYNEAILLLASMEKYGITLII